MTGSTAVALSGNRIIDEDGSTVDVFPLPTDEASLMAILRTLFEDHWQDITFGPIIQGAAWEIRASQPPTHFGVLDGYLTVAFGPSHTPSPSVSALFVSVPAVCSSELMRPSPSGSHSSRSG